MASWRSMTKIAGSGSESGSISQRYGSPDPDPHQNDMDPQHCCDLLFLSFILPWFRLGEGSKPTAPMGGSNPAAPAIPALSNGGSKPPRISPPTACDAWSKAAPAPKSKKGVVTVKKWRNFLCLFSSLPIPIYVQCIYSKYRRFKRNIFYSAKVSIPPTHEINIRHWLNDLCWGRAI